MGRRRWRSSACGITLPSPDIDDLLQCLEDQFPDKVGRRQSFCRVPGGLARGRKRSTTTQEWWKKKTCIRQPLCGPVLGPCAVQFSREGGVEHPGGPEAPANQQARIDSTGHGGGGRFWTPTTPPTDCWPEAPWGGGGGSAREAGGGGGECSSPGVGAGGRAPPNSWVCCPVVIRQFAPPLPCCVRCSPQVKRSR